MGEAFLKLIEEGRSSEAAARDAADRRRDRLYLSSWQATRARWR